VDASILIFVIGAVGAALVLYFNYYAKKKRREELSLAARQLGLAYSPVDFVGILSFPFALLQKGDGRGAENLLTGSWQGIDLVEFDYWYYDERSDSKGKSSRTYHHFSCVMAPVALGGAHLTLGRENVLTRLANGVGLRDIEFETEEFNNAFNVRCADRKFANDVVDQRMMAWLLQAGGEWSYEVVGGDVLVHCDRLKPLAVVPLLGTLKGFRDQIPPVAFELYGSDGSG
jgi:hypothetical protein